MKRMVVGAFLTLSMSAASALEELSVPSDPKATYFIIDKGGTSSMPTLTTRRRGPSGDSYAIRIFDCRAGTSKYLADSETLSGLKSSTPEKKMSRVMPGSTAWYQYKHVCK